MNRIDELFKKKKSNILSIYFTAGYPELESTMEILTALEKSGADMIEIGIPFSDPVADGPVIQESSHKALRNGMSVKLLLQQLSDIRKTISVPIILMGYLNPVLQFGFDHFCKQISKAGIDGLIIPDLPPEEFLKNYSNLFGKYNLHNILLVTPQTSPERIQYLDTISSGFLYLVSSASTTGSKLSFGDTQASYFSRVAAMNLSNPLMIGFGISDKESLHRVFQFAPGGIIGTAFIRALENGEYSLADNIQRFFNKILNYSTLNPDDPESLPHTKGYFHK